MVPQVLKTENHNTNLKHLTLLEFFDIGSILIASREKSKRESKINYLRCIIVIVIFIFFFYKKPNLNLNLKHFCQSYVTFREGQHKRESHVFFWSINLCNYFSPSGKIKFASSDFTMTCQSIYQYARLLSWKNI